MTKCPEEFIPFAENLANIAGEIVRQYFRSDIPVEQKEDLSPVTLADKEVERAVRAVIRQKYPEHGIISEEFENIQEDAEYVWIIDPIDGTKSFLIGRPIFGTLIALVHKGVPILGLIDQPILGERWTGATGYATHFNYDIIETRACAELEDATLCTTSPNLFKGKHRDIFESIREQTEYVIYGGDCYNYGLLANGTVDLVLETGLSSYDFCALAPIVKGAKGIITDWEGEELTIHSDGKVIACGDKTLHAKLLPFLTQDTTKTQLH